MHFRRVSTRISAWLRKDDIAPARVVEFGDFTEPDSPTAVLRASLPKEEFRQRPEVWRWNGEGGSIDDNHASILLATGRDIVTPNKILQGRESDPGILFEIANEAVLFEVADGKPVKDFRQLADFLDLETFAPSFTGKSARERYYWMTKVEALGRAHAELDQKKSLSFGAKHWGWFVLALGGLACAFLLLMI